MKTIYVSKHEADIGTSKTILVRYVIHQNIWLFDSYLALAPYDFHLAFSVNVDLTIGMLLHPSIIFRSFTTSSLKLGCIHGLRVILVIEAISIGTSRKPTLSDSDSHNALNSFSCL